jgi:hypothetical protein
MAIPFSSVRITNLETSIRELLPSDNFILSNESVMFIFTFVPILMASKNKADSTCFDLMISYQNCIHFRKV